MLEIKSPRNKFKKERAYRKHMQKLSDKHGIVIEMHDDSMGYWINPKMLEIIQKDADQQGKTVEDLLLEISPNSDTILKSEQVNSSGNIIGAKYGEHERTQDPVKIDIYEDNMKLKIPEEAYQKLEIEAQEKGITVQQLLEEINKEIFDKMKNSTDTGK